MLDNRGMVGRDLPGSPVSFFVAERPEPQGGSDFPKVSELDGSSSGCRTRSQTTRPVVPVHNVFLPLMRSVACPGTLVRVPRAHLLVWLLAWKGEKKEDRAFGYHGDFQTGASDPGF